MKKVLFTMAFAMVGFAGFSQGSLTASHQVNLNLTDIVAIELSSTADLDLDFTTIADYEDGVTDASREVAVRSTQSWTVDVKASSDVFSFDGAPADDPSMSAGVLSVNGVTLSDTDQELTTGSAGDFDDNVTPLTYVADPGFNNPEGTYSIDVVYTVTAD